jgi:Immunity protein family (Imm11)
MELFVLNFSGPPEWTWVDEIKLFRDGVEVEPALIMSGDADVEEGMVVEAYLYDTKPMGDFLYGVCGLPIITKKVRDVFENNGVNNIEYLPTLIKDPKGKVYEDYYVARIVGVADIVDWKKSKWTPLLEGDWDGVIYSFEKIVRRYDDLPELNIFYANRLFEIIVRGELATALQAEKLTALEIVNFEQYSCRR